MLCHHFFFFFLSRACLDQLENLANQAWTVCLACLEILDLKVRVDSPDLMVIPVHLVNLDLTVLKEIVDPKVFATLQNTGIKWFAKI